MSQHQIARSYGYKMFRADTIDELTLEQYNTLIAFWNSQAREKINRDNPHMISITTVPGLEGVDYGD